MIRQWLMPKLTKSSPISFTEAMEKLTQSIKDESIKIRRLTESPWWLKILSRNNYCSYKDTVYVPDFHMYLIQSESKDDSSVAMSKLLPWVMVAYDKKAETFFSAYTSLYQLKTRCFYWLYEYFYLMASENKYSGLIRLGFMTTRRRFGIIKLDYEEIEFILNYYLGK